MLVDSVVQPIDRRQKASLGDSRPASTLLDGLTSDCQLLLQGNLAPAWPCVR